MHSADVKRGFLIPCSQAMACELRVSRTIDHATPWVEATKTLTHSGLASALAQRGDAVESICSCSVTSVLA